MRPGLRQAARRGIEQKRLQSEEAKEKKPSSTGGTNRGRKMGEIPRAAGDDDIWAAGGSPTPMFLQDSENKGDTER